ncbi:4-hydroxy-tetrahydrodipicolinate synthase [Enhydrobacter aerosaccus]|uniref:4-hydroxy-tetrahydrodipicolinate synthase n=1 Tax=Enhydrobacter aerosaccus TaxID=225324 RepID=A0A1T4T0X9_9HYPH|nr:4-hydroxy-tetrahydrodipicolinate synthase [Enhydrobacter aerosaccus]SKA33999.1 4-hydroxy-tetrahydrodipicolinate synthase [Enhydrobacter aerosaccus]
MSTRISGLWVPLVTPFKDGAVDFASYERLVAHYIACGADGLFPLGTTGESPTLDEDEVEALIERTLAIAAGRVPVFVGIGGNATRKVERTLERLRRLPFEGIVSVCPYYNRPSQDGLIAHFRAIAEATDRDVLIYNIPYRTAVNLSNDSLLELAKVPNIVGVKDSSGSIAQSLDLLARKPAGFSVLTGEDALYFTMMANGADGGILAASHLMTERFVEVGRCFAGNDLDGARRAWAPLASFVPLLFAEANPMPIKYCLWRQGLITSPECRLPLTRISETLAHRLDALSLDRLAA